MSCPVLAGAGESEVGEPLEVDAGALQRLAKLARLAGRMRAV